MIAGLHALGRALRRMPVKPTSVAALLGSHEAYAEFRRIVRVIFPEYEAEILAGHDDAGGNRESARVWSFLHRVEAEYFPVYELDEYDQVVGGIPFIRNGWSYERFHELDLRTGDLLLFTLCAQPVMDGYDSRVALLDAGEAHVPRALLTEIPQGGLAPAELHERLDGTSYAAAAEFADWLWGETETAFLDLDEEVQLSDSEWSRETVLELAAQWERARGILDRIGELAAWLEADPPAHFARLLDAALGRDPQLNYEHIRRLYACEITEAGVVPIPHDDTESVALSLVPAG